MQIGALAAATGLTTKTIRFYEGSGLLPPPPRTAAGYRDYPDQAATRLRFIREAQRAGLTLAELRSILELRDLGLAPCERVAALLEQHLGDIEARLTELKATRAVLRDLAARAAELDPETCAEEDICVILADPTAERPVRQKGNPRL